MEADEKVAARRRESSLMAKRTADAKRFRAMRGTRKSPISLGVAREHGVLCQYHQAHI